MVKNPPAHAGDLKDVGLIPGLGRSPGGGHGSPLQYSCVENPMNRGAQRATVHRVARIWTRLKRLSTHTCMFGHPCSLVVSEGLAHQPRTVAHGAWCCDPAHPSFSHVFSDCAVLGWPHKKGGRRQHVSAVYPPSSPQPPSHHFAFCLLGAYLHQALW